MKKHIITIICILSLIPVNSFAMFGEEDWLSGQNALLTQILVEEKLRNNVIVTDILPRTIQAVRIANDTLASVRDTYRLYKTVRSYTSEQLLEDIKTGLGRAFPGINELNGEINEFGDNITKLQNKDGGKAFFAKKNQWDTKTSNLYDQLTIGFEQKSVFPWLFPHASYLHEFKPSAPEKIFVEAMINSGMDQDLRYETIQRNAITRYAVEYDKQAEQQGNLANQIAAKQLLAQGDIRSYLYDLSVTSKMELAQKEDSEAYWKEFYKKQAEQAKKDKEKRAQDFKDAFDIKVKVGK